MPAPLVAAAVSAAEALAPMLARIGLQRWFSASALNAILAQITLRSQAFAKWVYEWTLGSMWWKGMIAHLLVEVFGRAADNIDDLFDDYGGDLKTYAFSLVNDGICEGLNDAIFNAFGVETNITKIYPLDDTIVLENLAFELGKVVAHKLNVSFGTNFVSVFPLDDFKNALKDQLIIEIQSGSRRILNNDDVDAILTALTKIKEGDYTGEMAGGSVPINAPAGSVDYLLAEKRYYNRMRQRKYALTHRRVSQWVAR